MGNIFADVEALLLFHSENYYEDCNLRSSLPELFCKKSVSKIW